MNNGVGSAYFALLQRYSKLIPRTMNTTANSAGTNVIGRLTAKR
jgi:hypothetical protein